MRFFCRHAALLDQLLSAARLLPRALPGDKIIRLNYKSYLWANTYLFFVGLSASCFFACDREVEEVDIDFGYEYYPLEVGRSWYYQVDSIIYDPAIGGTAVDSSRTFIRETIADTLPDNTGALLYRVERYERSADTLPWAIKKVFTLSRDEQRAYRTEDNLRFITLAFPPREGASWESTLFFNPAFDVFVAGESIEMFKGWRSQIISVGEALNLGQMEWEEVLTVEQANNENILERRYVLEHYVAGVGLVYREMDILDTGCRLCCDQDLGACEAIPWEERAEKGFQLRQWLMRYE